MKKATGKRRAALLLAVILLVTLCAGCGSGGDDPGTRGDPVSPKNTAEPTEAPAPSAAPASPADAPEPTEAPAPTETPEPTESPDAVNPAEPRVVHASTVEEFIAAVAPNTEIVLDAGVYDFSQWAKDDAISHYGLGDVDFGYVYGGTYGDYHVCFYGLDGLTITGSEDGTTEIVTEYPYADVLNFNTCTNITLRGLTMGHTVERGFCTGDVLEFDCCENIVLSELDLYGCGTYGIVMDTTFSLTMTDSVIRECSDGILQALDSSELRFENCEMRDCEGYGMLFASDAAMTFVGCSFTGNEGTSFASDCCDAVYRFEGCDFGSWESAQASKLSGSGNVFFDEACTYQSGGSSKGKTAKTVTVRTVDEFFEAVDSNTNVVMEPGLYNLTEWLDTVWQDEGDVERWNNTHDSPLIGCVYDGFEAVFCHLNGLTITSSTGNREDVQIVVEPRYANVLTFSDCSHVALLGVTVGHTERGDCSGDVLYFENCSDVSLTNVDLYGCGVTGITYEDSRDLFVCDSLIRDCSGGAVAIYDYTGNINFLNTELTGSGGGYIGYHDGYDAFVFFVRCTFGEWESNIFFFRDDLYFTDCIWSEITSYPDYYYGAGDDHCAGDSFGWDFSFLPVDNEALADTDWAVVRFTNLESGYSVDPWDPDYADDPWASLSLFFAADGTGTLMSYSDGNTDDFTWTCDSDYGATLEFDDGTSASVSLYADYYTDYDADLYLTLSLGDCYGWFCRAYG